MKRYIIRLDDISWDMNYENFARIKNMLVKYDVRPIIGIIPDNNDTLLKKQARGKEIGQEEFWEEMRCLQNDYGWKIAVHGYDHVYITDDSGILGINNFSEFSGLSYDIQYEKISSGKNVFRSHGIDTDVFMAPGHSFDEITISVLINNGITTITDGIGLFPYVEDGILFVPQTWWWPHRGLIGIETVAFHVNEWNKEKFCQFETFLRRMHKKCISFNEATDSISKYNKRIYKIINEVYRRVYYIEREGYVLAAKIKRSILR
ncbi:MAG: DUF2334 domain-containing protein [Hungatella sp.]|nr:DUF2334 domain-containing protein [Hungatella sp.]